MAEKDVTWTDYLWTYLTTAVVVLTGVAVYRLAGDLLGEQGFAEYAMSRRVLGMGSPLLILGLGVAIPRTMALNESRSGVIAATRVFTSGAVAILAINMLYLALANGMRRPFAALVFGGADYDYLVFPVTLLTLATSCHALCYSYFRGRMQFRRASVILAVNSAVIPLAAFTFFHRDAATLIRWTGWLTLGFSATALLVVMLRGRASSFLKGWRTYLVELLSYGMRRLPGDSALALLLSLPSVLTAHYVGFREGGLVAFGGAMLLLTGRSVQPISMILLPQATRMFQSQERQTLQQQVRKMVRAVVVMTVVGTLIAEFAMEFAINLYLGSHFQDAVGVCRVLLLGAVPYVLYVSLRSVLDAAHERAVNARNTIIALGVLLVTSWLIFVVRPGLGGLLFGAVAGLWTLGLLTALGTWRVLSSSVMDRDRATRTL